VGGWGGWVSSHPQNATAKMRLPSAPDELGTRTRTKHHIRSVNTGMREWRILTCTSFPLATQDYRACGKEENKTRHTETSNG
jgi:hypothetical protein